MGPVRIGVGTEWLLDGRVYRVIRQTAADQLVALDTKFNSETTFTREELLEHYCEDRLTFAVGTADNNGLSPTTTQPHVLHDLDESQQRLLRQRWRVIAPLTQLPHKPSSFDFAARAKALSEQGQQFSARTIRRYYSAWRSAGKDRMALLPVFRHRGGRGRCRQRSWLARYPQISRFVDAAIHDVYLTKARRPVSAVARRVLEDLQRLNARLTASQAIPIPKSGTLDRAIRRRIARMDPWEVDKCRWGKQIADRRHSPTSSQRLATRILERVEIDHTPLKVVVGTKAGPLGQPWLTVLIDYHSRMIVGFCLGFEPPSYAVIMEALRHAILPKQHVNRRYAKLQGNWPCYGVPERIVCDRGSDLTSKDLENAAFQLGITLDFNPPRTPHFKGAVESFFGGLNDQLISSLPGRTFRSWEKRADYKPDDGPLISYEGLLEIIHVYLVDVYSVSKHPASHRTRLEIWQESASEHPPCLPATTDDLVVLLSKRLERTLLPRGIELAGMFYNSDELMALRAELAANNISQSRVQVRYNPWDLGQAWILNPLDNRYLKAAAVDRALDGMTEYQWKVLRRATRERFDRPDHLMNLAAGRNTVREIVEESLQKPSRKRRVRAARFAQQRPVDTTNPTDDGWVDVPQESDSANEFVASDSVGPAIEDTAHLPPSESQPARPEADLDQPDINPSDIDVDDWDAASSV